MADILECALMAGVSYRSTRGDVNRFPIPDGWWEINQSYTLGRLGFEAVSFIRGDEVVISYAGTDSADFINDMVFADAGTASGFGSSQLIQAAEYYIRIRKAYPSSHITLTGHSLGGGLASLIAIFFNEDAHTFDQAPFRFSATSFQGALVRNDLGKH